MSFCLEDLVTCLARPILTSFGYCLFSLSLSFSFSPPIGDIANHTTLETSRFAHESPPSKGSSSDFVIKNYFPSLLCDTSLVLSGRYRISSSTHTPPIRPVATREKSPTRTPPGVEAIIQQTERSRQIDRRDAFSRSSTHAYAIASRTGLSISTSVGSRLRFQT